jgi:uncharacterized membrane protein
MRLKRLLKHRWLSETRLRAQVSEAMLARLTQAVRSSEQLHSGEVRIYVETALPLSYLWRPDSTRSMVRARAVNMFGKLRVWDTEQNNGVLIYLLLVERSIEIVADRALARHVSQPMWFEIVERMRCAFKAGDFETGLQQALEQVSNLLIQHFPLESGQHNPNELPDQALLG